MVNSAGETMGHSRFAFAVMALLFTGFAFLAGCRPDRDRSGKKEPSPTRAQLLEATAEVHPAARGATAVALVMDDSKQLCADLLQWEERNVHLVCDAGPSDPEGRVLRAGLQQLRKQLGHPLTGVDILLLATVDRGADVRALMAREPAFFSRAAVWTEGRRDLIDQFGPTFLSRVAGGGAEQLVLLGASEKEYAPWVRLARRGGLQLEPLAGEADASAVAMVERLDQEPSVGGRRPPDRTGRAPNPAVAPAPEVGPVPRTPAGSPAAPAADPAAPAGSTDH